MDEKNQTDSGEKLNLRMDTDEENRADAEEKKMREIKVARGNTKIIYS
jgi:hypothetical protein